MIKAGIIGVTGYTGIELLRLLNQHPNATVTQAFTESYVDQCIAEVYPHLRNHVELTGKKLDVTLLQDCDVVFISLPHGHAIEIAPILLSMGKKVIDLGADFRLKDPNDYRQWYQSNPPSDALLKLAIYGLPETGNRKAISNASFIANPGCYPTASILAAYPALKAGMINEKDCIFDAKSGISGAGRSPSLQTHYCEAAENISPYHLARTHRHTPELEQELGLIASKQVTVQFTPHIVPMTRGLLVTAYFKLLKSMSQDDVNKLYQDTYQHEAFIRICSPNKAPQVKQVRGSNFCDLGIYVDTHTERLIVVSAIDNLIKGAAGQAIQNMNLMYQLPETMGLIGSCTAYP